jgi:FkbM family methyltransferase
MLHAIKEYLIFSLLNVTSFVRKVRTSQQIDRHKVVHLQKQVRCRKKWYGSSYGGFYIHPALLNANSVIYSFGIGKDITFDIRCIRNHGCRVFAFDPTPKSINWIRSKKINPRFTFFDYGIACQSGLHDFFLPSNPRGTSGSLADSPAVSRTKTIKVLMQSFHDITTQLGHHHIDVVKMDIEGEEYAVLDDILSTGISIDQILVEFHDRIFDSEKCMSAETVRKLNDKGYVIFGHSINFEEVSFIRKELLQADKARTP